jgi:hypothetical protein
MDPSGVGAGSMAWLPKTALRDPLGRVPSALRMALLRCTAAVVRL